MLIYFTRHGYPDYDLDLLIEKGRYQAEETSKFLSKQGIERFFVSPNGRAKETAQRTLEKTGKKATVINWLSEDYLAPYTLIKEDNGEMQWPFWCDKCMKKFVELKYDPNWLDDPFIKETNLHKVVELENANVDEFLLSIGIKHDRVNKTYTKISDDVPEKIGVFAHGGMAFAFLSSLLDMTYPAFMTERPVLDMCGVVILKINFESKPGAEILEYNRVNYDINYNGPENGSGLCGI